MGASGTVELEVDSLIGGEPVSGGEVRVSDNPARPHQPVGRYGTVGADRVGEAVAVAAEGGRRWRQRSAPERGRVLRRAAELLAGRIEEFAALLTAEEGKTLADSRKEVALSVEIIHYHAASTLWPNGETFGGSRAGDLVRTLRVPLGVVGIITPWNYPLSIPAWKLAPALAHGNAVVWKPASPTPILSIRFAALLLEAGVEPGALSVLLGDGAVGAALVDDPGVAGVSFTGSEGVGMRIGSQAAARNAKCQLELGGHNPAIVAADADLDATVEALVRSVANGTGQKCTAARRIIVERAVHDDLVARLEDRFAGLAIGDGAEEGVDVGPLVGDGARDEVAAGIDRALDEGCERIVESPPGPDEGAFLSPTLLHASDQRAAICREEVFGPVSVVIPAADADEALALASDTRFGLSAALFTRSERLARRAATELEVGILNVNGPTTRTEIHVPFGGMKASGSPGYPEQGTAARDFYTETRTIIATELG